MLFTKPFRWLVAISVQEMALKHLLVLTLALSMSTRLLAQSSQLERSLLSIFVDFPRDNDTCTLPTVSQQTKCFRDPGLQGVLRNAGQLVQTCKQSFMYEPWQCTTNKTAFMKGTRETGLLYALYAAALAYAVSQACARNELTDCRCFTKPAFLPTLVTHMCPDDVEFGIKFTQNFLNIDHRSYNQHYITRRHNALIGLKVVDESVENKCKWLGACSIQFCYKRLKPFSTVIESLKSYYQSAKLWKPSNDVQAKIKKRLSSSLLFTDWSSHCDTRGRLCLHHSHCAHLCCGRGFNTRSYRVYFHCRCHWAKPFRLECDVCQAQQSKYFCK